MAGFSLLGKVGLDISGFKHGLNQLNASAGPALGQFSKKIRSAIGGAFTGYTIYSGMKQQIDDAQKRVIDSRKYGYGGDMLQVMEKVASNAGTTIDELVGILKEGGPAADEMRSALEGARQEMEDLGVIVSNDTTQKLDELGKSLDRLMGRLGPIFSTLALWLTTLFDKLENVVQSWVGFMYQMKGVFTDDNASFTAGLSEMREGVLKLAGVIAQEATSSHSAVDDASGRLARIVGVDKTKHASIAAVEASSLVQAGGLTKGMTAYTRQVTIESMANDVKTLVHIAQRKLE